MTDLSTKIAKFIIEEADIATLSMPVLQAKFPGATVKDIAAGVQLAGTIKRQDAAEYSAAADELDAEYAKRTAA